MRRHRGGRGCEKAPAALLTRPETGPRGLALGYEVLGRSWGLSPAAHTYCPNHLCATDRGLGFEWLLSFFGQTSPMGRGHLATAACVCGEGALGPSRPPCPRDPRGKPSKAAGAGTDTGHSPSGPFPTVGTGQAPNCLGSHWLPQDWEESGGGAGTGSSQPSAASRQRSQRPWTPLRSAGAEGPSAGADDAVLVAAASGQRHPGEEAGPRLASGAPGHGRGASTGV